MGSRFLSRPAFEFRRRPPVAFDARRANGEGAACTKIGTVSACLDLSTTCAGEQAHASLRRYALERALP